MATIDLKFSNNQIIVRDAKKEDMTEVSNMIQELADYEKMPHGPQMTARDLVYDGFTTQPPAFQCKVAELQGNEKVIAGYALYFPTYSSWQGRSMMLEDLYVTRCHRRKGVGEKLFNAVAKVAAQLGCTRLDFHVLEWNDARGFYENKGALNMTNKERWCYYRLAGEALTNAAKLADDD